MKILVQHIKLNKGNLKFVLTDSVKENTTVNVTGGIDDIMGTIDKADYKVSRKKFFDRELTPTKSETKTETDNPKKRKR